MTNNKGQITQNMVVGGIIVFIILGVTILWMINAGNINKWLKILPQYDAPESETLDFTKLSEAQIRSICPEVVGYVSKSRKNKISFIEDPEEDVSKLSNYPFKSELEFNAKKGIIEIDDAYWINPMTKDTILAEITDKDIEVGKWIFNPEYESDFSKKDYWGLGDYDTFNEKLRQLDGAYKLPGEGVLICRIEESEFSKKIKEQLKEYENKKCQVDEDYKVTSSGECYCLDSQSGDLIDKGEIKLQDFTCNQGAYCYDGFVGCKNERLWEEGESDRISLIITAWINDKIEFFWDYKNDYGVVWIYPNKKTPYEYIGPNAKDLINNRYLLDDISNEYLKIIQNILSAENKCDFASSIFDEVSRNKKIKYSKEALKTKQDIFNQLYGYPEIPSDFCDY
ncbi:MAG: hypothetical protein ACOCUU_01455 [Nanoarchaeota archaeon]